MLTNLWKNFVYLFAKSEFVNGQFPPAFVILFLRTCLCIFNRSHFHSKWSVVCGLILQRHVGSSIILNLWKYVLSLPCPVIIVEKFMHICSLFDIPSFTTGKNVFVNSPLFEALVCVVCYQIEVSAKSWSLVHRVLLTVVCYCVWSRNLRHEEAMGRVEPQCPWGKKN